MKKPAWFEISLAIVVMGISLYAAFSDAQNLSWRWFTRDDAYYYFKVAQNISEGHGSTFDGINRTNGYHPLWMLVCIPIFALARFDLILPLRVLLLVMGALSAATAILFYRLLGKVFHPAIGALAAFYWAFNYNILARVYQQGLETGVAVFFIVLLVYKLFEFETAWRKTPITQKQLLTLGFIALLAVFSRLDLIFLAGMVGIWIVFRASPLRYFLPLDIVSILISVLMAFILRLSLPEYYHFTDAAMTMIAVSLAVKIPLAYFLGLYQPSIFSNVSKLATRMSIFLAGSSVIVAIFMLTLTKIEHFEGFPRITLLYDLLLTALFFSIIRLGALGLKTNQLSSGDPSTPLEYLRRVWRQWAIEGAAYYGIVGAGTGIYMLYNKISFGTFSPVSGQIKRWWGSLPGRVYDGPARDPLSFFGISHQGDSNAFHPLSTWFGSWIGSPDQLTPPDVRRYIAILAVVIVMFYLTLFINRQKAKSSIVQLGLIPLIAGSFMQILYYHALGYSAAKEWYWTSQLALVVLAPSMICVVSYRAFRRVHWANRAAWVLAIVFGTQMLPPFWLNIRSNMTYNEWKPTEPTNDIAAFLEARTEPGSIIGMTGGGNAGYFIHDRIVINMDGLINSPEYFQLLKERKAGEYLADEGMDYILANFDLLQQLPYKGQFAPYTEWMDVRYGGKDLVRFRAP